MTTEETERDYYYQFLNLVDIWKSLLTSYDIEKIKLEKLFMGLIFSTQDLTVL